MALLLRRHIHLFLLSLGFLTRLAPARSASDQDMAASCLYFPLAGAALGCLLVLPFWLGLFGHNPWLQAWLYVGFSLWLTRSLHHDGLADLLDALGSGKTGEEFRAVLKDSRIGVFGVVGLVMALSGQLLCAADCFGRGNPAPLVYAPLFARCLPVFLALTASSSPYAGLGKIMAHAPLRGASVVACGAIIAAGLLLLPPPALILTLVFAGLLLLFLVRVARAHGGCNGDYFGAIIITGELAALLAAVGTA